MNESKNKINMLRYYAQNILNDSLSQGSLICFSYAYFFSTSEPEYAYKSYAYKKNIMFMSPFMFFVFERFEISIP